ncbi:MAG: histidine phosphatase family protein [SAR202 cluster bacterium]|nr:hypothetical protein [Chloroflexota bacterium]MDP6421443.1 histidine phosphatase family protein [SAR202 cluster bacterium]HAL48506.1 hypothetical protein [Dehalococcoidia bacterium]MDP6664819.1 histidine phosphatase family protein [SAR202 cluster bacterium]MDP6799267.1 histidine phosphatase family protein [SAR202 cluster bacterium]|tara:strand:- start:1418 stop:2062 length:645 start_codon:yes stop_codon:yes gene_type:complete
MNLIFVRHGESMGNAARRWQGHADAALSDTGREQARKLQERFVSLGYEPTHVYSSPQSRAFDTATIATEPWDLPIAAWDDLMEVDVGVISGLTWDEFEARFPETARNFAENRNWDDIPGAERMLDRSIRARRALERLISDHTNEDRVVAFAHGGIISHLFAELMGSKRLWSVHADNTAVFEFMVDVDLWEKDGPALVTSNLWRIIRFNDTSHLG